MNISDIPMTAPTLVPVSRNVFRADLLEAAAFFLSSCDVAAEFELMVGDDMMARQGVSSQVSSLAAEYRAAGDLDPSERFEAQLAYARGIVAEGTMTPGRKLKMLDDALNGADFEGEFLRGPEAAPKPTAKPSVTIWGNGVVAMELLNEALQALQYMTLGQLRAHRINPTLLDRMEAVLVGNMEAS